MSKIDKTDKEKLETLLAKFKTQRDGGRACKTLDHHFKFPETYLVTITAEERSLVESILTKEVSLHTKSLP